MDTIRKVFQTLPYLFCLIAVLIQIQDFVADGVQIAFIFIFSWHPPRKRLVTAVI